MKRHTTVLASVLLLVAAGGPVAAQSLPSGAELIARYQKEIGGRAAVDAQRAMHMTGTWSMPAQGMGGSFQVWSARPNRSIMKIQLGGMGEMQQGYTGDVAWALNPMEGPRVMSGAEAVQAADDAAFESFFRPASLVASARSTGRAVMGGKECIRVEVKWKSGRETIDCYGTQDGLLIGTVVQQAGPAGTAEVATLYGEYRTFGELRMPTRMTLQLPGVEQVLSISSISFDAVPDSVFAPPPEIRALIRK